MLSKTLAAISAVALIAGSSAAAAQTAQSLSLAQAPAAATTTDAGDLNGRRGAGIYIIGAIVIALLIWGGLELLGDDDPESP